MAAVIHSNADSKVFTNNYAVAHKKLSDLTPDSRNANKGTPRGNQMIEHCLGNSTQTGTAVLDLFGGSGSTLIACEKTGRRCYMCELSPAYCDVIIKRWELATGKHAVLVQGSDHE
jgi:DNA modification methylase